MAKKWDYGGAIDRYPIKEGEQWQTKDGTGTLKVHDMYQPLPDFMKQADFIVIDPPWNLQMVNGFYTKADKKGEHTLKFNDFYMQIFRQLDKLNVPVLYIEIGKQNVKKFEEECRKRYEYVEVFEITYYKKHPCFFIRASKHGYSEFDFTGWDEWDAIKKAIEIEPYGSVGDFMMGRGLVAEGAYEHGKKFYGTELNPKRLAVTIEKLAQKGAEWEIVF